MWGENNVDKIKFGEIFAYMCIAFPEADIGKETMQVYYEFLGHYPEETLKGAIKRVIEECKWFPKVAEIRSFAGDSLAPSEALVMSQIESLLDKRVSGKRFTIKNSHPVTQVLIEEAGGLFSMGRMSQDKLRREVRMKYPSLRGHYINCQVDGRKFLPETNNSRASRLAASSLPTAAGKVLTAIALASGASDESR